jgi:FdhD protein
LHSITRLLNRLTWWSTGNTLSVIEINILKINHVDKGTSRIADVVAVDESLCIFLNGEHFRILLASPELLEELVVGHLFTESVISNVDEVVSLDFQTGKVYVELNDLPDLSSIQRNKIDVITTACGLGINIDSSIHTLRDIPKGEPVDCQILKRGVQELNRRSSVFKNTGGTHSALLLDTDDTIIQFAEDVGRHNAVDKVLGAGLKSKIDFSKCVLVVSGRLSAEMVLKAAKACIPIVGSLSAPLMSGIRVAEKAGVTLVGFIRGRRMNVYTHSERISLS